MKYENHSILISNDAVLDDEMKKIRAKNILFDIAPDKKKKAIRV